MNKLISQLILSPLFFKVFLSLRTNNQSDDQQQQGAVDQREQKLQQLEQIVEQEKNKGRVDSEDKKQEIKQVYIQNMIKKMKEERQRLLQQFDKQYQDGLDCNKFTKNELNYSLVELIYQSLPQLVRMEIEEYMRIVERQKQHIVFYKMEKALKELAVRFIEKVVKISDDMVGSLIDRIGIDQQSYQKQYQQLQDGKDGQLLYEQYEHYLEKIKMMRQEQNSSKVLDIGQIIEGYSQMKQFIKTIDIDVQKEMSYIYEMFVNKYPGCSFKVCYKNIYINWLVQILVDDLFFFKCNVDVQVMEINLKSIREKQSQQKVEEVDKLVSENKKMIEKMMSIKQ